MTKMQEHDQIEYNLSNNGQNMPVEELLDLKERLYTLKLEIIKESRAVKSSGAITLKQFRSKVEAMPRVPMHETGIYPLDHALGGGIELGSFVQLGAPSFVGKTKLTLEILANVSKFHGVVFFNYEMGARRIYKRLRHLNEHQAEHFKIYDEDNSLEKIESIIEFHAIKGDRFFGIDSKMKIAVKGLEKDHQKFAEITKRLSLLCQRLDIIILFVQQMSEDDIKHKRLAYKGGGDQFYDGDINLFYIDNGDNTRKLICEKNRTGDEHLFAIDLKLDDKGNTVDAKEVEITYQNVQMPKGIA